jgi:dihydrofolate synthase/folylpolyglutamate synthase
VKFSESEKYLRSLGNEVSTMKLGLENISKLLAALGNPEDKYVKVQVAGTNGKGSVCAFLDSICREAGIVTGSFTSPHLVSITERIKINGRDISEEDFARAATHVRKAVEKLLDNRVLESTPTFFEHITAIGLLAFAERGVKLAILETGLGGRLDATTAANAEIAVITKIDYDHQQYLGETLEEIAAEKASIIMPGSRVAALRQRTAAARMIRERCIAVGVEPVWATSDIETTTRRTEEGYLTFIHTFKTNRTTYPEIEPLILGRHQTANAALAIAAAEILEDKQFDITELDICIGLETAVHPGRLEFVEGILLDGAHNPGGVQALADFLDESIDRPLVMIFGAMRDKDVNEIAKILFPKAAKLIMTKPDNSRAYSPEELADLVRDREVQTASDVGEALKAAKKIAVKDNSLIVITGSLYLVGEAKKILNN